LCKQTAPLLTVEATIYPEGKHPDWRASARDQPHCAKDVTIGRCVALYPVQVSRVVLVDDIQLQEQTWQREDRSRPAFVSNRSITITSRPPYRAIDFAFLATNWLKMASGTRLNISNTILKQSRYEQQQKHIEYTAVHMECTAG
jgi:hypothetical protein